MRKTFFLSLLMLFTFSLGTSWADVGNVFYTATFLKGTTADGNNVSGYDASGSYTTNGITWTIPGNNTNGDYIRIGGKSITNKERVIASQSTINDAIAKIEIAHLGKSRANVSLSEVIVLTASDAAFTQNVVSDTVREADGDYIVEKSAAGTIAIYPAAGQWTTGSYYKFIFVVSNSDTSNGGVDVQSIKFYSYQSATAAAINADDIDLGIVPSTTFPVQKQVSLAVTGSNLTDPITYNVMGANVTASGTLTAAGGILTVTISAASEMDIDETIVLSSGSTTTNVSVKANFIETSGDGTSANPFSVADVVKLNNQIGTDTYWVKGYILGCASNGGALAASNVNTNIALGDNSGQTTNCIPVELPSGTIRTALNVVDHPEYIGQQVKVKGQLISYFSYMGVKAVSDYELILSPLVTASVSSIDFGTAKQNVEDENNAQYLHHQMTLTGHYLNGSVGVVTIQTSPDAGNIFGVTPYAAITPTEGSITDYELDITASTFNDGTFSGYLKIYSNAVPEDFDTIRIPLSVTFLPTYPVTFQVYDNDRCTLSADGKASNQSGTAVVYVVDKTEPIAITCYPKSGWAFSEWQIVNGADVTIDDVNAASTTAYVGEETTITAMCTWSCTSLSAPYVDEEPTVTYNSATLTWWTVNNAEGYKLNVVNHATNEVVIDNESMAGINNTTKIINGLTANTQYDYTIMAYADGYCDVNDVKSGSFTTADNPAATLTLSEAGTEHNLSGTHKLYDVVTLPTTAEACTGGKELVGWSTAEVAETNTTPTMYEPGGNYTITSITDKLYAVYGVVTTEPIVEHSLGSGTFLGSNEGGNTASDGYTFSKSTKGDNKAGYIQDSGTADESIIYLQISATNSETQIISEQPSTIVVTAHLGAGANKDPLTYPVYAVLVDGSGNDLGASVVLTNKITNKNGEDFSVNLPTANYADVRGVKISHKKEDGWNVRYYSMSFKYTTGGSVVSGYSTSCTPTPSISVSRISMDLGSEKMGNGDLRDTLVITGENLTKEVSVSVDHAMMYASPNKLTPEADGTLNDTIEIICQTGSAGNKTGHVTFYSEGEIDMPNVVTVTATIRQAYYVHAISNNTAYGYSRINNNTTDYSAEPDEVITLTATALSGYEFVNWTTNNDDHIVIDNVNAVTTTATVDAEVTITANFQIAHTYSVVGTPGVIPAGWDQTSAVTEMTLSEGVYSYKLEDVILSAGTNYEYKIVEDHAWTVAFPQSSNATFSVDKSGRYDVTFTLNKTTHAYAATPELLEEIQVNRKFAVLGGFNGWEAPAVEVAADAATASFVANIGPSGNYQFKVQVNGSWLSNGHTYHRGFTGADGITANGDNMILQVDQAGEYTFTWTFETNALQITFPKPLPEKKIEALDGVFSIGEKVKAQFSRGNLCFHQGESIWYAAEKQYDILAQDNLNFGDASYKGSLDLFGWSCESSNYGLKVSNKDEDFTGDFVDWGNLFPGDTRWSSLSKDEWNYLMARKDANNNKLWTIIALLPDAQSTDTLCGLVLFPDDWVAPASPTVAYGFYDLDDETAFASNILTYAQWDVLEQAGAVFLPTAGSRAGHVGNTWDGTKETTVQNTNGWYDWVDNEGWVGYYWLSTPDSRTDHLNCANYVILPGMYESPAGSDIWYWAAPAVWSREKRRGNSVRLVTKTYEPQYYLVGSMNDWNIGADELVAADAETLSLTKTMDGESVYEFKVVRVAGPDTTWLTKANNGEPYGLHRGWPGVAGVTDNATENLKLTTDVDGDYVFTWTLDNDSLGITFPRRSVAFYPDYGHTTEEWTNTADLQSASITMQLKKDDGYFSFLLNVNGVKCGNNAVLTRHDNSTTVPPAFTGQMDVTLDVDGDYVFTWTYATNTLTVTYPDKDPEPAGMAWVIDDVTVTEANVIIGGDNNVFPTFYNPNDVSFTFSSSDETVATIEQSGWIELKKAGSTVISATFTGNEDYQAQVASYTLHVSETGTGIHNTEDGVQAVKILRDGKLFILRGDKTYDATGQIVQ